MSSSHQGEPLTCRVIQDVAHWDAIRRDWDDLYAVAPAASTPLDFFWLRTWWETYGTTYGPGGLRIVTAWRRTRLVGALPLFLSGPLSGKFGLRSLRFISTGEVEEEETCPDYLNLLFVPEEEDACVRAVSDAVARMSWDQLELLNLSQRSPLLRMSGELRPFDRGSCPVANLSGGFEAYLQRLSWNARRQMRRLVRQGEQLGAHWELVRETDVDLAFEEMARFHQRHWTSKGKPGAFASQRFVAFHRTLILEWLPRGRAVLARMSLAGAPVVVLYGFVTRQKFDCYQSAIDHVAAGTLRSPGTLAHLLLMKSLAEGGVTEYDFLRGPAFYKTHMATGENRLVSIRAWRPTPRALGYRSARLVGGAVRATLRPFRETPKQ